MSSAETYQLYAIRFAERTGRRAEMFLGGDPRDEPMGMDYFVWVAVSDRRAVVIDTGFTAEEAARRGRAHLRNPVEVLLRLGVEPSEVRDVVLTHLHYDHVGYQRSFPNARVHLQERELHFAVGRDMQHPALGRAMTIEDVVDLVRDSYAGRIAFHDGDAEVAPGLSVHFLGGHTAGLQVVRVETQRGAVVIGSDASHYYENFEAGRPFAVIYNVSDTLRGFDRMRELAALPQHIIPGHDPLVMRRYPAASAELERVVVRLDVEPMS